METSESRGYVMIVDDEVDILLVLERYLSRQGYKVLTADCGETALRKLQEHHVDLVVLDVVMPNMNGLEVLKELKKIKPGMQTMIMTANSYTDNIAEAFRLGACDCIFKPFNLKSFNESISANIPQ